MNALLFFKNMSGAKLTLLASSPLLTLVMDMKSILTALLVIILFDMITGIRKSFYINKISSNPFKREFWRNLNSSGLRSTWRKTYEYGIGIIVFMTLDHYVLHIGEFEFINQKRNIVELAISVACVIEVYSIFENMEAVSGNNLLKKLIGLLPEKVKKIFKAVEKPSVG
mgnify:CR=1 FL=1|jgi:hypothetical protein